MKNAYTHEPLRILQVGSTAPYLNVPGEQVPQVTALLEENGIEYDVDPQWISFRNGPWMTEIVFRRSADRKLLQRLLDHQE